MMIKVRSIPEEGLDASFEIDPEVLRKGFDEEEADYSLFNKETECSLHLDLNKQDVFVAGEANTTIHPVCSRCGESFEEPLTVDIAMTCTPGKAPQGGDFHQESDEGVVYYRNGELDLSEIVREQLLLALPIQHFCRPDCQGVCLNCGANLNQGAHACKRLAEPKN